MRVSLFKIFAAVLHTTQIHAAFRPDLTENVQVVQLEPEQKVSSEATEIPIKAYPGSDFEIVFFCTDDSKQFTFSSCHTWVACCLPGQILLGSETTAFDCCEPGQELLGSKETKFHCCPAGTTFDECMDTLPPPIVCPVGEVEVNDVCVCPPGQTRSLSGLCEVLECSSGVQTGKCYTFTFENGLRFGYNSAGFYTASEESRAQQFGKFQLCADESCALAADINPGDGFYIKDIHGEANGGKGCKQWLNNAQDGAHITKTPDFKQAGAFTITKWPCDKYCLGGLDAGLGPTCPTEMVGATFTTLDDQSCVPMTLLEVPCDIRNPANNCLWTSKEGPCDKTSSCAGAVEGLPEIVPRKSVPNDTVLVSSGDETDTIVVNASVAIEAKV